MLCSELIQATSILHFLDISLLFSLKQISLPLPNVSKIALPSRHYFPASVDQRGAIHKSTCLTAHVSQLYAYYKTGNVGLRNVTLTRVRVTIVALGKQ